MPKEASPRLGSFDAGSFEPALALEVCPDLSVPSPALGELERYLGYPADAAPGPRIAEQIEQAIALSMPRVQARGVYALYAVAGQTARSLQIGGVTVSGQIGKFLAAAERVAVFAVTAGSGISACVRDATRSGDMFAAWVADAVGSWAAESAADALMLRVRRHLGEAEELTLRYSPGYCGMPMREQRHLFALMPAAQIGVFLLPSLLMQPLKSISGLVGLAPAASVARHRSPCDVCPRVECPMRR